MVKGVKKKEGNRGSSEKENKEEKLKKAKWKKNEDEERGIRSGAMEREMNCYEEVNR